MLNSKYSKVLTIVLVIVIVASYCYNSWTFSIYWN